ncbi:unnamed protein product [Rotaria sordida]|uniref:Integrase catalytic domain-containing protein n=2 Tax=Rotaria sordida TaxID=392033 RepID=A0A815QB01_9BILA|nr:unnamed protein product [Rotaria sordida]
MMKCQQSAQSKCTSSSISSVPSSSSISSIPSSSISSTSCSSLSTSSISSSSSSKSISITNSSARKELLMAIYDKQPVVPGKSNVEQELEKYLTSTSMVRDEEEDDILGYWREHQKLFPLIASIARKILAIPASNTSVERLFSSCKNTITDKRTRLGAEKLNKMMFLQKNMNLLQKKFHVNFAATNDNQNTNRKNDTTILNEQSIQKKMKLHEVAIDYQDDDEYLVNIESQHNCLADYLSHHPIQNDEGIFDEDYGISMLFQGEPLETVHAPVNHPPIISTVVTRSKMKQIKQQQNENDKITLPIINDISSSSSKDKNEHSNKSPSHLITSNSFDITQIKLEQSEDSNIQKKIKEVMQDPTKHPYVVTDGLLYKLILINVASNKKKKKPDRLNSIPTPEGPFQLISIDYCGSFKPTSHGNQYVLCITDYFTKWMTAIALPDCSVQTTAQTLFNNYICQYDVPLAILSDQGTHFKNQLMESIAKLIGYNHIFSSVYHPQNLENNNWDEFLSPVVFAYNTNIHATTNYSPFQLQFGRESRLPTDEPLSSFTFNKPNDYNVQLKKNLLIIQQHAHGNIIRQQR